MCVYTCAPELSSLTDIARFEIYGAGYLQMLQSDFSGV